ncbi:MAG: flavodoxin-dependent (E)-4-hydroxy-3-methylbut-2-enyl-diphosphate synthase [Nitrospiraceae bacterium]|nr:flavodoxin-dependent (E)-4-hydroxy-3-methylbut-2-enyl-diphosphate synthase [Nitrospiraceae bacterium]
MRQRRSTKELNVGNVGIGGSHPISVQSMTKTDTRDAEKTLNQITSLACAGCEIIRIAVPDMEAAEALSMIVPKSPLPVIADIHFDWRLALKSLESGVHGLRLNPGNIGARWKVEEVVAAATERSVPIRIGVNAGSLEKHLLDKYGHPTPEAIVESAEGHISILEELGFNAIKVSLKASDVLKTVEAYRIFSAKHDYPLHIGISESGPPSTGIIKSSVGLGVLLYEGIGDTMRVSLTSEPEEEVRVAYEILKSLGLRERGANLISCPTCGRCEIDMRPLAQQVQDALKNITKPVTVAVMGCVVNGPGEAREADFGVAGGKGMGLVFKKGEVVKKVKEEDLLSALMDEINRAE